MKYDSKVGKLAYMLMTASHKRLDVLNKETLNAVGNVYYRIALGPPSAPTFNFSGGDLLQSFEEDMKFSTKVLTEAKFAKDIIEASIKAILEMDRNNGMQLVVIEKLQEDLVDIFKYGIDNPGKKWGFTKSRERKNATVYDIDDIILLMSQQ